MKNYAHVFFAHNGPGPYECHFCGSPVTFDDVVVHHDDGDHENDDPANLKAAHDHCHKRHHTTGRKHSAVTRAKMRAACVGREPSFTGRKHTEATRQKMRESWARRKLAAALK